MYVVEEGPKRAETYTHYILFRSIIEWVLNVPLRYFCIRAIFMKVYATSCISNSSP